jgi:hypothetical protein
MKAFVKSFKHGGKTTHKVRIEHKHQSFTLDYHGGSRAECRWLAKMFNTALKYHDEEKLKKASKGVFTDDSFLPFPETIAPVCE